MTQFGVMSIGNNVLCETKVDSDITQKLRLTINPTLSSFLTKIKTS